MRIRDLGLLGMFVVAACGGKVEGGSDDASGPQPAPTTQPTPTPYPSDATVPFPSFDASVPFPDVSSAPPPFDGGISPGCEPPGSLAFAPIAIMPLVQQACTSQQVTDYYNDCLNAGSSQATCSAFMMGANAPACASCISTYYAGTSGQAPLPPPAPAVSPWGPLVTVDNLVFTNVGACVQLADPSTAGQACGTAVNTVLQCEYEACATACPVEGPSAAELMAQEVALENCTNEADQSVCATPVQAESDACAAYEADSDAGPASFCFDTNFPGASSTPQEAANFYRMILQQCGTNADP